jgi:hypothetical protein
MVNGSLPLQIGNSNCIIIQDEEEAPKHRLSYPSYVGDKKFAALPKLMESEHSRDGLQRTIAFVLMQSGMSTSLVKMSRLRSALIASAFVAKDRNGSTPGSFSAWILMYCCHGVCLMRVMSFLLSKKSLQSPDGRSCSSASDPLVLLSNLITVAGQEDRVRQTPKIDKKPTNHARDTSRRVLA